MKDENLEVKFISTPTITPSADWLERRTEQLRNVKIVVGEVARGKERVAKQESGEIGVPVVKAVRESLSPLEGFEFEW